MVGQMPGVNFWSDKCQEDNIVTIWLPISHFVNLTFSQSDILKFLYFDNLTILHGWQLHIVDNLDILTIWKFKNFTFEILHLKFNNLKCLQYWYLTNWWNVSDWVSQWTIWIWLWWWWWMMDDGWWIWWWWWWWWEWWW